MFAGKCLVSEGHKHPEPALVIPAAPPSVWEDFEVPAHARGGQVTLNLYDHLAAYAPKRPGAYLRISSDRFGLEAGVDRQLEDAHDTRKRLAWGSFTKVYKENDTSAFKKKKVIRPDGSIDWVVLRPEFRQLLADLASGVIDGVVFYDLDRLVRQPRDLEDLIDIVEYVKKPVIGATGGRMNLINDSDRHMARMMCVMALKSSEDTARRVARQHLAAAQDGQAQGRTAFGWIRKGPDKGKIIQDEADVVTRIFQDYLSGESAYSIAKHFNEEGIEAPSAKLWSSTMVTKMLRNPRYAGMVSYAGRHRVQSAGTQDGWSLVLFDDDGRPLLGSWESIVTPKVWAQVQFEMQLRRQKMGIQPGEPGTSRITANKHLLSGILRCNKCMRGLVGHSARKRKNGSRVFTYVCPPSPRGGCGGTYVAGKTAEAAVVEAMEVFLLNLLTSCEGDQPDAPAKLTALVAQLDQNLARKQDLINRWSAGTLDQVGLTEEDYFAMLANLNRKIQNLRETIAVLEGAPAPKFAADELIINWRTGTIRQRRAILKRYLHHIVVKPAAKPNGFIRTSSVKERLVPNWKMPEEIGR
ncbi:recombinase family protein [Streptomyces silvisoli]|uniref:Recombinase family protein n=1 Tax=Streptomyces silvisoli TaxID=3034235 RepID=A0ABT5ZPW5_9ACTN|nr:recombinase family protein [Streptomyces silvisoli]MDF3291875.1 recombinase family protein [Streptomyces silvisoli]